MSARPTHVDRARVVALHRQGLSRAAIAERLGVSPRSVSLALQLAREAEAAAEMIATAERMSA